MNWSEMQEGWNELSVLVQARWPKLTDAALDDLKGDRTELARALQRHYGFGADEAEKAICEFEKDACRPGAVK